MKALVATELGLTPKMAVETRPIPRQRKGFTLVRIHAATANPLSNQVRAGIVAAASAPLVLSNDGSGVVERSDRFAAGTRVAIFGGSELGISEDGLQQQWAVVEDKRLMELPGNFDLDAGAALPVNYITAYQALTRVGQVADGQILLISGASGAVGHALIEIANALGARPIGIASSAEKAARARKSGAVATVDLASEDLGEAVLALTGGKGADLAFDPVGGALLPKLIAALRPRGAVVSIGFAGGTKADVDVADIVIHEKRLLGYDAWLETDGDIRAAVRELQRFIAAGKLNPSIDSRYQLEQYEAAYDRLESRRAMGSILLYPWPVDDEPAGSSAVPPSAKHLGLSSLEPLKGNRDER